MPFWNNAAAGPLLIPRCTACGTFRWPAGALPPGMPFPADRLGPGGRGGDLLLHPAPPPRDDPAAGPRMPVPAAFADTPGVRLVSVLIDAPTAGLAIGAPLAIDWLPAANVAVPVFRFAEPEEYS